MDLDHNQHRQQQQQQQQQQRSADLPGEVTLATLPVYVLKKLLNKLEKTVMSVQKTRT